MTNKPFNIFDKLVPSAKSTMLNDLELTTVEFDALKKQIAHGLGQVQHVADAHDELANAVGELGSATNPIGCASVPACLAYLRRLRPIDGSGIVFTRKGAVVDKAVSQYPIDVYVLTVTDSRASQTIYMSGYQPKNATTTPEGFTLAK